MAMKLVSVFLEKEQEARLDKLSAKTRVPKAVYIRDGIDLALKKYEKQLKARHIKR
jgi:predicted DNA-binding protein